MREEEIAALQETAFRAFLATMASFVAYGIHFVIACASIYIILTTKRQDPYSTFHIAFISSVLAMGTVNIALWSTMMIDGWKMLFLPPDHRSFEHLPLPFIVHGAACASASILITILCDGLLLYRCCIIWENKIYVAILPALLYLAAVGLGIADVSIFWSYRQHNGLKPYPPIYRLTAAYWFTLLSLNVLLTLLIVVRIVYLQRSYSHQFPGQRRASTRSRNGGRSVGFVVALLAESSLLYSLAVIVGLAFNWWFFKAKILPPQAVPLMIAYEVSPFNPYLTHLECIASELIILRVALGRTWFRSGAGESTAVSTDLQFHTPSGAADTTMDGSIISSRRSRPLSRQSIAIPLNVLHEVGKDCGKDDNDDRDRWNWKN